MKVLKSNIARVGALVLLCILAVRPVSAFAISNSEISELVNGVTDPERERGGEGIFDEITGKVGDIGTSAKKLALAIGVMVLVISLIVVFVQFSGKSAQAADEAKKRLVWIIVAAILALSSVTLIAMAGRIGDRLSEKVSNEHLIDAQWGNPS